jgi:hypothetical protein
MLPATDPMIAEPAYTGPTATSMIASINSMFLIFFIALLLLGVARYLQAQAERQLSIHVPKPHESYRCPSALSSTFV